MLLQLQLIISGLVADIKSREEGQAMVEYALILALVAVIAAVAFTSLGSTVSDLISNVISKL
jgi:Flp pilus assembly pilin Flp